MCGSRINSGKHKSGNPCFNIFADLKYSRSIVTSNSYDPYDSIVQFLAGIRDKRIKLVASGVKVIFHSFPFSWNRPLNLTKGFGQSNYRLDKETIRLQSVLDFETSF